MPEGKDTQSKNESRKHRPPSTSAPATVVAAPVAAFEGVVESLGVDFSEATFQRHADLLADSRLSHRSNAGQRAVVVRRLQRDYGNAYVRRLVDHVKGTQAAEPNGSLADSPLVQAAQDEHRRGEEYEAGPETSDRIEALRGSGRPLEPETRQEMEATFGRNLGGVRVHTGAEADQLNTEVDAEAFTTGKDIFFRNGNYAPESPVGKELLAHELTHVVQDAGTRPQVSRTPATGDLAGLGATTELEPATEVEELGPAIEPPGSELQMAAAAAPSDEGAPDGREDGRLDVEVDGEALTTDKDIFFRNGNYVPESPGGKELLAHELTHVVQQIGRSLSGETSRPSDPAVEGRQVATERVTAPVQETKSVQETAPVPPPGPHVEKTLEISSEDTPSKAVSARTQVGLRATAEATHLNFASVPALGSRARIQATPASGFSTPAGLEATTAAEELGPASEPPGSESRASVAAGPPDEGAPGRRNAEGYPLVRHSLPATTGLRPPETGTVLHRCGGGPCGCSPQEETSHVAGPVPEDDGLESNAGPVVLHRSLLEDAASAVLPGGILNMAKGAVNAIRNMAGTLTGKGQGAAADAVGKSQDVSTRVETTAQSQMGAGQEKGQAAAAQGQERATAIKQTVQSRMSEGSAAATSIHSVGPMVDPLLSPAAPVLDLTPVGDAIGRGVEVVESIPEGVASLGSDIVAGVKEGLGEGGTPDWDCDQAEIVTMAGNVKRAVVDKAVSVGKGMVGEDRYNALMAWAGQEVEKIKQTAASIKDKVDSVKAGVTQWWHETVGPWIKKAEELGKSLESEFEAVKKWLSEGVNELVKWGAEAWEAIKTNVIDKIGEAVSSAKEYVAEKLQWARNAIGSWWDKLPNFVKAPIVGAGAALAGPVGLAVLAGTQAASLISQHKDSITSGLKATLDAGFQALASAYNSVKEAVIAAHGEVKEWADSKARSFSDAAQAVYKTIDDATGGRIAAVLEAAAVMGAKISGATCTALGKVAGPCIEQFMPNPKDGKGFAKLSATGELNVPIYKVPVKVGAGASVEVTRSDKIYEVIIQGDGLVAIAPELSGGAGSGTSLAVNIDLPVGKGKAWERLTGSKLPGAQSAKPAGAKAAAEAGIKGSVSMTYRFDAAGDDTTCDGLGGMTALLATQGLAAALPAPYGNMVGTLSQAAYADRLTSCKFTLAQYGKATIELNSPEGIGTLKAAISSESGIAVVGKKTDEGWIQTAKLYRTVGGSLAAELASGLGAGAGANATLSVTLAYNQDEELIKALDVEAKLGGSITITKIAQLTQLAPSLPPEVGSAIEAEVQPLLHMGSSGVLTFSLAYKVTNLHVLFPLMDALFKDPDSVTSDKVMTLVSEHLEKNRETVYSVKLRATEWGGGVEVKGESAGKGGKIGGGIAVKLETGYEKEWKGKL